MPCFIDRLEILPFLVAKTPAVPGVQGRDHWRSVPKGQARSRPRPFLKVGDIVSGSQLISEFAFIIGELSDGVFGLTYGQLFISLLAKC